MLCASMSTHLFALSREYELNDGCRMMERIGIAAVSTLADG